VLTGWGSWIACPNCDGHGAHYDQATCEDDVRICQLCEGQGEIALPMPPPRDWVRDELASDFGLINPSEEETDGKAA
jgi:hypothetical protein